MDPVSAIGLAASSLQLASFVFTAALKSIRLVKDLKDVPARLRVCLADAENSVHRLWNLQSMLADPNSKLGSLLTQSQRCRFESVVRDGHDATEALHKNLGSLFPQQTVSSSRDRVKAAWKNVVSLGMEKEVEDAAKRIQRLNDEIAREFHIINLGSHVDLRMYIDTVYRREQEVTRAELQSLRDAVLPVITGQSQTMSVTDQTVAIRLSDTDKSDLARQLCEALLSHPSALRQSCDNAMYLPGQHRELWFVTKASSRLGTCVCSKSRKSWTSRLITGVGLEYDLKTNHHSACPLASYTTQSWSYTLSLSILPLVSRTVALTFGAKHQGGGWSISPALKVFATVRRATSPMFQAFDELLDEQPELYPGPGSVNKARARFVKVQRLLLDMLASGTGSLTDRDESNHTLLHEIAFLMYYLYAHHNHGVYKSIPEIRDLLNLAYSAGVDAGCKASNPTQADRMFYDSYQGYTAQDMVKFVVQGPESWDLVGPGYFGKFGMDGTEAYTRTTGHRYLGQLFYAKFAELVEELGPLGPPVLQRSTTQLISILQSAAFSVTAYNRRSMTALMYLAARWHDGLPHLLEAGFPPGPTIMDALREDDLQALKIASTYPGWTLTAVLPSARLSSDPLQQFLVDAVRKQRDDILQLCYKHLTMAELAKLKLPGLTPLDANIALAHRMLGAKGILTEDVRYMRDGPAYSSFRSMIIWGGQPARIVALLEKLYAAGFRDIDGSVLFASILWERWSAFDINLRDKSACEVLSWLAAKASLPLGSIVKNWPSAMFDLAFTYGESFARQKNRAQVTTLLAALTTCCDATQRDACECFCSQGGCLPSRLFLTRKMHGALYDNLFAHSQNAHLSTHLSSRDNRDQMLRLWCQVCLLDEKWTAVHLEDSVRVEVFDRLGMVHTCCEVASGEEEPQEFADPALWCLEAWRVSDEERRHVQNEDAELNDQLELIMEAYGSYAQGSAGSAGSSEDMLKGWWRILDEILPQTHDTEGMKRSDPEKYPDLELCDRRAAMEREVLVRMGYGDLDFLEVIRRHFRDYLEDEDERTSVAEVEEHALPTDDQTWRQESSMASSSARSPQEDNRPKVKRRNSY
ncbi:hypothetical protein CONLIGDRAFT_171939 [Coniochaeta ligniaria NRRL 30616]|uniref:Fungal N-terminal domain-containing protein n=1 Tax=Coniochaeta ligniaria NRRL 30616 TaxID=1408157 RepID=A0A1J7J0Q9_9PEZI|nr:hypothetical protein CONLIGDRAFT_171939 [Coniochaeta ligniaria NRRL 30616]